MGTLDVLVGLSDELAKLDSFVERYATAVFQPGLNIVILMKLLFYRPSHKHVECSLCLKGHEKSPLNLCSVPHSLM